MTNINLVCAYVCMYKGWAMELQPLHSDLQ
jgi:hypothetical protein